METLIVGTIFLVIGILIKIFPSILAGYNNLSQSERANGEKNGLRFYASLLFFVMATVTFLGYPLSIWLEQPNLKIGIISLVTIVGMIIAVIGGNFLTNNRLR